VLWSWSFILKKLKLKIVKVNVKDVKKQLKASAEFFASRIATTVYSASNVFALSLYGYSDADMGIYGAANTLISYGKRLFPPIADSLYPYMIKNKNHKLVRKILLVLCPVILVGCVLLFVISDFVISLMAGREYMDSVPIFRCMIPMLIVILPSYLYGFPMLGSIGRNDKANQSVFIGAGFHFVGLVLLFATGLLDFYSITVLTTVTETIILITRVYFFNKYKKLVNKGNNK
jgi:PST family polysaccharide transporter